MRPNRGVCLLGIAVAALLRVSAENPSNSIELILEQSQQGKWAAADPRTVFHGGDELRFQFKSSTAGYLYVLDKAPSGEFRWLYPTPESGMKNLVEAGSVYVIPASAGSFVIPENPGFETLYWILSPEALPDFDLSKMRKKPSTLLPRCGSELTPRGGCLDKSAGPRLLERGAPLTRELSPGNTLTARELKVDKAPETSHIRFAGMSNRALIYEYWIAHR